MTLRGAVLASYFHPVVVNKELVTQVFAQHLSGKMWLLAVGMGRLLSQRKRSHSKTTSRYESIATMLPFP